MERTYFDQFIHNTHIDSRSESNIDLIISNRNIIDKIECYVHDDTLGSDHFPITISLNVEKSPYIKKSLKLRSTHTNWENVYLKLDSSLENFYSFTEYNSKPANKKCNTFVKIVTESIISSTVFCSNMMDHGDGLKGSKERKAFRVEKIRWCLYYFVRRTPGRTMLLLSLAIARKLACRRCDVPSACLVVAGAVERPTVNSFSFFLKSSKWTLVPFCMKLFICVLNSMSNCLIEFFIILV